MFENKQLRFGIIVCVIAICYLILIPFQVSLEPLLGSGGRDKINAAFFPVISGVFLLGTGLAFCRKVVKSKTDEAKVTQKELVLALLVTVMGFLYVFLIQTIGYKIPTIAVLAVLCYALRPKPSPNLLVFVIYPVAAGLIIYYVFSKFFYVSLP
jgi:hypothetical protein